MKTQIGELNHIQKGCGKGVRPNVPCHHIREYRYAYGAVEPLTGESCFLVMPYCNTACMNLFLQELSNQFPEDTILLCCDGAAVQICMMLAVFHMGLCVSDALTRRRRQMGVLLGGLTTIGLVVFPSIFVTILGLGKSQYIGNTSEAASRS